MPIRRRLIGPISDISSFKGYRFPPDVITLAVRWYLRYGLSCRDVEELLAERGIEVDHVTLFRWVHHFTPLLIEPPVQSAIQSGTDGSQTKPDLARSATRVCAFRPAFFGVLRPLRSALLR